MNQDKLKAHIDQLIEEQTSRETWAYYINIVLAFCMILNVGLFLLSGEVVWLGLFGLFMMGQVQYEVHALRDYIRFKDAMFAAYLFQEDPDYFQEDKSS